MGQAGGVAHETQRPTARGLRCNGGSDVSRHSIADALPCYFSHERRWLLEVLYNCWNSKGVLSSTAAILVG
jgi:hypothetical protein